MNDKVEEATAGDRSPGAILSAAREQHQWSVDDVSAQLRLSPRQVMALESNDFSALPEASITRGFMRNYARLLEIDAEPLLAAYRSHTAPESYAISIPSANILISTSNRRPWKMYVIASLAVLLLVGCWILYVDYLPKLRQQPFSSIFSPAAEQTTSTPAPLPAAPQQAVIALPQDTNSMAPQESAPAAAAEAVPETSEGTQVATAEPVTPTLKLAFSADSWVSVSDASNTELLNTIMTAGTEQTLQGQPPFKIVIGNAAGSQLTYNGEPVDLEPHTRLNVARITLE